VKTVQCVCDNEAVIKAFRRKRTQSVFHRREGDHDIISTIHFLQGHWCQDTDIHYEWVKGHADELTRDPTRLERMNIVADELCDVLRETAIGPFGARPNCGIWPSESCALFIRSLKVTNNWKEILTQQLLDGDLQEYNMQKEEWTSHAFNNICWKRNETASKIISKARQASTAKMCHNLRFTGARHELWYGEAKPCCMCGQHEDWINVLTCKSMYAEMIRAESWSKLKKQMHKCSLSSDMWIAMESDVRHYIMNPLKRDPEKMPPDPPSPFGTMFYTPINILKVAFLAQSQIGWEKILKGRLSRY
jgi:hypothetical protein